MPVLHLLVLLKKETGWKAQMRRPRVFWPCLDILKLINILCIQPYLQFFLIQPYSYCEKYNSLHTVHISWPCLNIVFPQFNYILCFFLLWQEQVSVLTGLYEMSFLLLNHTLQMYVFTYKRPRMFHIIYMHSM